MPEHDVTNFFTFDTHKYVKELEASGFPEQQAEVLIKSMLAARYYDASQLSTREQVEKFEKELREELKNFKKEIKEELKNFKKEVKEELTKFATREQMEKLEKDLKEELTKFATREQMEKLEKDLKEELTKFATREQMEKLEKELKSELKAEIASVKYDILKWIIPMFLGMMGMMLSIFLKLS